MSAEQGRSITVEVDFAPFRRELTALIEQKMAEAFTLERLEAQVARTQGRGAGDSFAMPDRLLASLREEAEEVCAAIEDWRQAESPDTAWRSENLKLELGDVINVAVAMLMHAGYTLREVMEANDAKLRARWPGGFGVDVGVE